MKKLYVTQFVVVFAAWLLIMHFSRSGMIMEKLAFQAMVATGVLCLLTGYPLPKNALHKSALLRSAGLILVTLFLASSVAAVEMALPQLVRSALLVTITQLAFEVGGAYALSVIPKMHAARFSETTSERVSSASPLVGTGALAVYFLFAHPTWSFVIGINLCIVALVATISIIRPHWIGKLESGRITTPA